MTLFLNYNLDVVFVEKNFTLDAIFKFFYKGRNLCAKYNQ